MKRLLIFALTLILSGFLGCGNSLQRLDPQGYHPGTDMQFFQTTTDEKRARIQETDNGCYLYHEGFVYSFDRETQTILPLCSKSNCLHDKETDDEKREECNSYVGKVLDPFTVSLMLYEKDIYVSYMTDGIGFPVRFIRISCDGSSKDTVYEESGIELHMLHRGYIYYISRKYTVDKDTIASGYGLFRLDIGKKDPKPELLYVPENGINSFGFLEAYGKYVYFDTYGYDQEGAVSIYGIYDTETGKTEKLNAQGMMSFFQGKLYSKKGKLGESWDYEVPLNVSTLEGNETKDVMNVAMGVFLASDDHYFYLNPELLSEENPEEKEPVRVYDSDMNQIDEFFFPEDFGVNPPVGGEKYLYRIYDDSETSKWGILYWDKSSIGTLNGTTPEMVKIPYLQ